MGEWLGARNGDGRGGQGNNHACLQSDARGEEAVSRKRRRRRGRA